MHPDFPIPCLSMDDEGAEVSFRESRASDAAEPRSLRWLVAAILEVSPDTSAVAAPRRLAIGTPARLYW